MDQVGGSIKHPKYIKREHSFLISLVCFFEKNVLPVME